MKHLGLVVAALFIAHSVLALDTQYESAGFQFVENALLDNSGGIYANYLTTYPNDPDAGVNHQMLAEYTGLAMEYAVYANKSDFFATQDSFVRTYLQNHPIQSELDLYSWRINDALTAPAASSATIDDFRIIDGYLQAAQKWDKADYKTTALAAAADLKEYTMVNGIISEAASWDADGVYASDTAILSYFDLPAMQRLAAFDTTWATIEQTHYDLITDSASALGNNGLYRLNYNLNTGTFIEQTELNTIHQALIAQHLAEAGHTELAQQSLDFYKSEYANNGGRIYGAYTEAGEAASPYEDISIYSILASTALFLGDNTFADQLFDTITSLQVANTGTVYDGAFMWGIGDRVYAFVQLQAIRALAQANPIAYVPEPEPTPSPTPEPTPQPTPEPTPEPDPVPPVTSDPPADVPAELPTESSDNPPPTDVPQNLPDDQVVINDPVVITDPIPNDITILQVRYQKRKHRLVVRAISSSFGQAELWITDLGTMTYQPEQQYYQFMKRIKPKQLPRELEIVSSWGDLVNARITFRNVRHRSTR